MSNDPYPTPWHAEYRAYLEKGYANIYDNDGELVLAEVEEDKASYLITVVNTMATEQEEKKTLLQALDQVLLHPTAPERWFTAVRLAVAKVTA